MENKFYNRINKNPIIAAITDIERVGEAIKSPCEIAFLLTGSIFNLKEAVDTLKQNDKMVFVHLDLLEGISKDNMGIEYLKKSICPDGVISIKGSLVKIAKEKSLFAIQRFFLVDSLSAESGIKTVHKVEPDAVEIMPGIMHKITSRICNELKVPVITGGFINDKDDVIACLNAGAMGISTSNEEIWYM